MRLTLPSRPQLFAEKYCINKSWIYFLSLCAVNQFCRMSTETEEVKAEDGKPESGKKIFYCEVSAFLDGFSDYMLKCRPKVLKTVLLEMWT